MYRGFSAAGSHELGWFDGYYDASNSLRVAKSYLLALLMSPLLVRRCAAPARARSERWRPGWSRVSASRRWRSCGSASSFPGLLNFSSDYRATALFWEMHVGGAALDGFLALTVPFAMRGDSLVAQIGRTKAIGGALSLARRVRMPDDIFARGLPGRADLRWTSGVPVAHRGNARSFPPRCWQMLKGCAVDRRDGRPVLLGLSRRRISVAAGQCWACLHDAAVRHIARDMPARACVAGLALGVLAGAAGSAIAMLLFKGIYVNFALAFACCSLLLFPRAASEHRCR